jgi:DNA topoisomerase-1
MRFVGGAYSRKDIRPLWKKECKHDGVKFPKQYEAFGLIVRQIHNSRDNKTHAKKIRLSPEAEELVVTYAKMLRAAHPMTGLAKFRNNFARDLRHYLPSNSLPSFSLDRINDDNSSYIDAWDWDDVWSQMDARKAKEVILPREKVEESTVSYAEIDGKKIPMTRNVVDRPGIFVGRNARHEYNGKIRRRIRASDVTLNMSEGAPVPKIPANEERSGWGAIVHDRFVNWLARWEDPLTGTMKYVYLDSAAALKQHHERRKFDKAREFKRQESRIRSRIYSDMTQSDMSRKKDEKVIENDFEKRRKAQVATCVAVMNEFGIRSGNGSQRSGENNNNTVGAVSLRTHNVYLGKNTCVRLAFVGKDHVPFDITRKVPEILYDSLKSLTTDNKEGLLFPLASAEHVNTYLDDLLPGMTCKVLRTAKANSVLDERLGMIRKGKKDDSISKDILAVSMWEVAWTMNHKKAVALHTTTTKSKKKKDKTERKRRSTSYSRDSNDFGEMCDAFWKKHARLARDGRAQEKGKEKADVRNFLDDIEKIRDDAKEQRLSPQTAKVNYVDPRIIVAFCKRRDYPVTKAFTNAQLSRFGWAMDVDARFSY